MLALKKCVTHPYKHDIIDFWDLFQGLNPCHGGYVGLFMSYFLKISMSWFCVFRTSLEEKKVKKLEMRIKEIC